MKNGVRAPRETAIDPYAIHEAGHALVAALCGLPIKWVDLHPDNSSKDEWGWPTAAKGLRLRRARMSAMTHISLSMAGKAAEVVCRCDIPESDRSDREYAWQVLDAMCRTRDDEVRLADFAFDTAESLLRRNLRALRTLARALGERGRLTGAEVVEIVARHRRKERTAGRRRAA